MLHLPIVTRIVLEIISLKDTTTAMPDIPPIRNKTGFPDMLSLKSTLELSKDVIISKIPPPHKNTFFNVSISCGNFV